MFLRFLFFFSVIRLGGCGAGVGMEAWMDEEFYPRGGDGRPTKYPYGYGGGYGGEFFRWMRGWRCHYPPRPGPLPSLAEREQIRLFDSDTGGLSF